MNQIETLVIEYGGRPMLSPFGSKFAIAVKEELIAAIGCIVEQDVEAGDNDKEPAKE